MEKIPQKKISWRNLTFFVVTAIGSVVSLFYLFTHGISHFGAFLFAFFVVATGMSITVGYHRLLSHRAFEANAFVRFMVLFFGAAAFEQSAMDWASQHRNHHRYVDTINDPYNIKRGFFYAHIGWLVFWAHDINHDNVKDIQAMSFVKHQNDHYVLWAIASGIALPLLVGAAFGHFTEALLFAVMARLTLVHHATFCINSVCHMFGKPTFDLNGSARDHWFVAFLTYGEGYHSFHHRFPSDYRNAIRWYQWDPSKWMIAVLSKLGLAWGLKKTNEENIRQARLVALTGAKIETPEPTAV